MMKCKEYIFLLSSGQLAQAGPMERFWAGQHRMICRRCTAFTRNDALLNDMVRGYREHLTRPGEASCGEPAEGKT